MMDSIKVTIKTAIANFLVSMAKILVGYFGKSMAVLTDGVHSFSDFLTDLVLLLSLKISEKPADKKYQYGYKRLETLISLFIGFGLFFVGLSLFMRNFLVVYAFIRQQGMPQYKVSYFAGAVAFVTFIVKFYLYRYNYYYGHKLNNQGLIANAYENKSDAVSSLAIAIGTLVISILGTKFSIFDTILAELVALIILQFSLSIIAKNFQVILGIGSSKERILEIKKCVLANCKVIDVHNIRTRFEGGYLFVDAHLTVNEKMSVQEGHEVAMAVEKELKAQMLEIKDVVLHLEPSSIGEKKCRE